MAHLYPAQLPDETETSERVVHDAMAMLGDDWRVFHSVVWQSRRDGRQGDGEADFVILHPTRGIIVLEVKGGRITVESGRWSSTNHRGTFPIKNPFEQAMKSKHALLAYLSNLRPPVNVPIVHAVCFPNESVGGDIGTYGPRAIVLDSIDLKDVEAALKRVFAHWDRPPRYLDRSELDSIVDLLAPTTAIRTRLRDTLADIDERLVELTKQQVGILAGMKKWRRALIVGGPGTGKTVLAMERARELDRDGFRTLLTCFNAPLAAAISSDLGAVPRIQVSTFHHLAVGLAHRAGVDVPSDPDEEWWKVVAPDVLLDAAARTSFSIDAVVVDEAQDFRPEWLTALLMLVSDPDQAPAYLFADSEQALYVPDWSCPSDWPPAFELTINCRSTLAVAESVSRIFATDTTVLGENGSPAAWISAPSDDDVPGVVQDVVDRLLTDELVAPRQITVLADRRNIVDRLRRRSLSSATFVAPGSEGVAVETIHRFKGLETDVAIVCLSGQSAGDLARLAYVGWSRARLLLIVVADAKLKRPLGWRA